jgi:septal ring factor EnvC (AmiA/AmiB activator)
MPLPETVRRIADLALSVVAGAVIAVVAVFFWSDTNDPQVSAALHNIGAGQNTTSEIRAISDSLEAERRDLKMLSDQFLALASRLSAVQENTTLILRNNAELAERLKTTQTQIAQDNALVAEQLKATKAGTEASQLKKTADAGSADLRKSLQQERDRAGRLEQDLAAARRDVETQTALATKAGTEASQLKKTADAGVADLQKSLQQERDRASRLEQDLAAARRDVETQTALVAKAGADAGQVKKAADAGVADLQKSLQQERDRASRLEQDLAAARRDVETQTALVAKAGADAGQVKKTADAGVADLQKSLQQERDRAAQLEQDLAAARRDVETQTALAAKTGAEASELKKTADAGLADSQKSLQQERARAGRLEQDLAAARSDVETQTALAVKAGDEVAQLKQAAEKGLPELRQSLQQEQDKAKRLAEELGTAHARIYAFEAQERQTALAAKAGDEASQLKQAAESTSAELRKSLQQERDRAAQVERDLASALPQKNVPPQSIPTGGQVTLREAEAAKPAAAEQAALLNARADAQPKVEDAEVARLVVRARALIGRGDIGSARIVLQRAADAGNALACFTLAETYDPLMLSKWGTYGTRSDATKAHDLYARAQAGGIKEAKERLDALRR